METSCELHIPPTLLLGKDLCSMHRTGNWLGLGKSLAEVKRNFCPAQSQQSSLLAHYLVTIMTELQYYANVKKVIKQNYISRNRTIPKHGTAKLLHNM